jgi:transposase InsO family protein
LIHSDIWGPSPVSSINGFRYFVLFIDDFSRFTWIYFLKNRSELPQIYISFARMVKTQFSCAIKILRTDNAMEYRDSSLLQFLSQQGTVVHVLTPPNKMVGLNENIVTSLTQFVLFYSQPRVRKFFGGKQLLMLSIQLIDFPP